MKCMKWILVINKLLLRLVWYFFFLSDCYSIGYFIINLKVRLVTDNISNTLLDSDRAMMKAEQGVSDFRVGAPACKWSEKSLDIRGDV